MTIQELSKIYTRLCANYEYCNECPLSSSKFNDADNYLNAIISYPDEAELALLKWEKENPIPTNRDKFFEVFGNPKYISAECQALNNTCTTFPCHDCDWWDDIYVAPKEE